jgi:hypothetical protein
MSMKWSMSHVERACRLSFSALLVLTLMTYHVDLNEYRTRLNKTRSPQLAHMVESEKPADFLFPRFIFEWGYFDITSGRKINQPRHQLDRQTPLEIELNMIT